MPRYMQFSNLPVDHEAYGGPGYEPLEKSYPEELAGLKVAGNQRGVSVGTAPEIDTEIHERFADLDDEMLDETIFALSQYANDDARYAAAYKAAGREKRRRMTRAGQMSGGKPKQEGQQYSLDALKKSPDRRFDINDFASRHSDLFIGGI